MPTLYVTEQNAVLRKTGDRLIVEKEGEALLEVPCLKLDTVRIYRLCATCEERVEILGRGVRTEDPDVYIV